MQRKLDLIILGHLWALAPLALAWFAVPAWRGAGAPVAARELGFLAGVAVVYLLLRTYLVLTARLPSLHVVWPFVDVTLVTITLVTVRNPTDAFFALYFIPLASAVAVGSVGHAVGIAAAAVAGYGLVVVQSATAWAIQILFRLIIIVLMASLYGWVVRTVSIFERAAERAEFQRQLAREIHDGIQHLLVTMGLRLDLAQRLIAEAPARAAQIIAQERETSRRAADELRYLVRRLRPSPQAGLRSIGAGTGLATALRTQIAALADRWPFDLDVQAPAALPRLEPAAEHAVLRVIQECLTNVAKHAQARRVDVRLSLADHQLECSVRDDGVGFDPTRAEGSGLAGLYERVRSAGGVMEIHSIAGQGTTVTATFPLPEGRTWQRPAS